ncbi:MAG: zf-HC2 domain-containing protein, partial [Planctomycetota bacterium]
MSNAADPCGWVVDQIPRYLDGELPPDLAGRVAGHLAACGACRMRKSDEEQRIADVIHALVAEEPPEDLPARVVERIAAQAAPHRRTSLRLRLPAAAAVILAALVGFWALERRGAPGDRTASPGAEEMINEEIVDGAAEGGQPSPGQSDDPVDRD